MKSNARIWFEVHTEGSRRQHRAAVAAWVTPSRQAAQLAQVRAALGQLMHLRASTIGSGSWRATMRHRLIVEARDLLYHLRQARAAGVVRVRVPR